MRNIADMLLEILFREVSRTDLLSDTASFTCLHIGPSQLVQNESLACVDMPKDANYWTAELSVFLLLLLELFSLFSSLFQQLFVLFTSLSRSCVVLVVKSSSDFFFLWLFFLYSCRFLLDRLLCFFDRRVRV